MKGAFLNPVVLADEGDSFSIAVMDDKGSPLPVGSVPKPRHPVKLGELATVHIDGVSRREDQGKLLYSLIGAKLVKPRFLPAKPSTLSDIAKLWENA